MPVEIERKFRVISDRWRTAVRTRTLLRQGYLADPRAPASGCASRARPAGCRSKP